MFPPLRSTNERTLSYLPPKRTPCTNPDSLDSATALGPFHICGCREAPIDSISVLGLSIHHRIQTWILVGLGQQTWISWALFSVCPRTDSACLRSACVLSVV